MKRKIIVANWKMYLSAKDAVFLAKKVAKIRLRNKSLVLAPPFTAVEAVKKVAGKNVSLAGQDVFWSDYGAYTGEICGKDLKDLGCEYVIVGHSERRKYFQETDEMANKKVRYAQKTGLTPILCVGETVGEKKAGRTLDIIRRQLTIALNGANAKKIIIAYEPVWAIGTGNPENPRNADVVQGEIKKITGANIVLYGGSIDKNNFAEFLAQKSIDGLLIGGASAKWDELKEIIK